MNVQRRQFILGMAGIGLMPGLLMASPTNRASVVNFISARADMHGRYFLTGLDGSGKVRFDVRLPGRGHGMALHPHNPHAIAFARRPGDFLLIIDMQQGKTLLQLGSGEDRHFYGHGVFSRDGRWLFTTENDLSRDQGVIGIRDTLDNYRQVGEIPSHGIGPHELKLAADGKTLIIANGGILTRPETGRSKLNLDNMSPSLAYVDSESGKLLSEHRLPAALHRNSIRHLAINADDTVCMGLQYQGSTKQQPLLVGLHRKGETIKLLETPRVILQRMKNYCGSVTVDASGKTFAVSSPRGHLVTFWQASDGQYLGHTDVRDGCGVAATTQAGEFIISSGTGQLVRYRLDEQKQYPIKTVSELAARWDNHMI